MKQLIALLTMLLVMGGSAFAGKKQIVLDSNTAFYEGEVLRYTIPSPRNFKLVIDEVYKDGFSMAFVPRLESYDTASVMIGVNIYKTRGGNFDSLITQDTLSFRKHLGSRVSISEVSPLTVATGEAARTFYLKCDREFVPNVEIAYFDGGTEVIIFELVISESVLRYKAEQLFTDFVRNFKPTRRGTLGNR
jgi:hypothetical protein